MTTNFRFVIKIPMTESDQFVFYLNIWKRFGGTVEIWIILFFHRAEKLATGEKDKYILNLYWFFLVRGIEAEFQLG